MPGLEIFGSGSVCFLQPRINISRISFVFAFNTNKLGSTPRAVI